MKTRTVRWLEFLAFAVLTGCAAFATPQTTDQRIAAAFVAHTAVMDAAADSLAAGDITSDQAQDVLALADRAQTILRTGRAALNAGDRTTAEGQVALAAAVLSEVQAYLRAKQ